MYMNGKLDVFFAFLKCDKFCSLEHKCGSLSLPVRLFLWDFNLWAGRCPGGFVKF